MSEQTGPDDVMHELRHFHQDRAAGFPGLYRAVEEGLSDEVDAYAYVVRAGPLLGYTDDEMEETVELLELSIEALGTDAPERESG